MTVPLIPLTGVGCCFSLIPCGLTCTSTFLFSNSLGAFIFPTGVCTKELLTIPDYTYSLQQLQINENLYVQNEFMKQNNFQWLKRIIENIFEIQITKNSLEPLPSFINAMYNRQYTKAIIEYEKLNPNQKIFFKSSYQLAQIYNDNQNFLENMI